MRASRTAGTGASGQSFVKGTFEQVNWAVVQNSEHDLGTDLWVTPRDRRFDLGVMLGVQVKNGSSYLRERAAIDGRAGWWFRAPRDHLEYWLGHAVPHVLVIRNPATEIAYWAHVSDQSVRWTGKNGKVFIPADQVLGVDALDQLTTIASTMRRATTWAGSAWAGAEGLPPGDQLRFAMLAPRLVAPHPNRAERPVEPHEAIALLATGRFGELDRYGIDRHGQVPEGWRWDFFTAVAAFGETGDVTALRACWLSARDPAEVASATAAYAAALVESGDIDAALEVVERVLSADRCEPVDHAWLQVHLARCLAEVGRTEEAITCATQALRHLRADDVTAAAIAGAGSAITLSASGLFGGDVAATITAGDSEAGWWLTQSLSWGLSVAVDDTFRRWVNNPGEVRFTRNSAANLIRGASLVAGFSAAQSRWCGAISALVKTAFINSSVEPNSIHGHVTLLRRAGERDALTGIVRRLLWDGPAEAITAAASEIDPHRFTHTEVNASLAFLIAGADVVRTEDADRFLEWATQPQEEQSAWLSRAWPTFYVDLRLAELMANLVAPASTTGETAVRNYLLHLPELEDQAAAQAWAQVLEAVPRHHWDRHQLDALFARTGDAIEFTHALARLGFATDDTIRGRVLDRLANGDTTALRDVGRFDQIPADAVQPVRVALADAVHDRVREVQRGLIGFGYAVHADRALAILNVLHPDGANWTPIVELLEAPNAVGADIARVLRVLEIDGAELSPEVRDLLVPCIEKTLKRKQLPLPGGDVDTRAGAVAALGSLRGRSSPIDMTTVGRDAASRSTIAAAIARRGDPTDFQTLTLLASDWDAEVRATAAAGLTHWAVREVHPQALPAVWRLLEEDAGVGIAGAVTAQFAEALPAHVRALAEHLTAHRSATARNDSRRALAACADAIA